MYDERHAVTAGDRNATIKAIRTALQRRSGKPWSVTGGKGTAWGWIHIDAPPARRTWRHFLPSGHADIPSNYLEGDSGRPGGHMGPEDRAALSQLLGLSAPCHMQGESVPSQLDYRMEYLARAHGQTPAAIGVPLWD